MPVLQGSIFPKTGSFTFVSKRCSGTFDDYVPKYYQKNIDISQTNFSSVNPNNSTRYFTSDAVASWLVGQPYPGNQTDLDNLSLQIFNDYLAWLSYRYDIVYNGIVAPQMNATIDEIEVTYYSHDVRTRVSSGNYRESMTNFNHWDAGDTTSCANDFSADPPTIVDANPYIDISDVQIPHNLIVPPQPILNTIPFYIKGFTKADGRLLKTGQVMGVSCNSCCNGTLRIVLDCVYCSGTISGVNCFDVDWAGSTVTIVRESDGFTLSCVFEPGAGGAFLHYFEECFFTIPREGGTFIATVNTQFGSCSQSINLGWCESGELAFTVNNQCAYGCLSPAFGLVPMTAVRGATFSLNSPCASSTFTTDSTGCGCFNILTYDLLGSVTFSKTPRWQTVTYNPGLNTSFTVISGGISPASSYICYCGCNEPIKQTLSITDRWGTTQVTYSPTCTVGVITGAGWCGTSSYNATGIVGCATVNAPVSYLIFNNCSSPGFVGIYAYINDPLHGGVFDGFGSFGGTCPDSATGAVLMFTGSYSMCFDTIPINITEV